MAKSKKRKKHNKNKALDNANTVSINKLKEKYDYIDINKNTNDIAEECNYKNISSREIINLLNEMFLYKALVKIYNGEKEQNYIYYKKIKNFLKKCIAIAIQICYNIIVVSR